MVKNWILEWQIQSISLRMDLETSEVNLILCTHAHQNQYKLNSLRRCVSGGVARAFHDRAQPCVF